MADKVCKFLEEDEVKKFVDSMETFIFDCDGVLWNGVGVIDGAVEVLQELRKSGKRVFFVTNNSSKSRKDYANKLENFGIKVSKRKRVVDTSMKYFINKMNHYRTQVLQDQFEKGRVILASDWCQNWNRNSNAVEKARKTVDEIYGTSYAVAYYLKEILKFDKKVFTIGTTGMTQELDELGIPHTGSGPDQSTGGYNIKEWTHLTLDPEVGAVVCGFDEHFSYHKLIKAASYLAKDTCLFIATNCDDRFPFNSTDIVIPGTGCLVISVETAARRKATVVGKPERIMFDCINSRHNIDPSKTCMIGDRLNTDILFGNNCGLKTVLVLTGISSLEDVKECQASNDTDDRNCIPDFYISSIDALRLPLNPLKHV